ncbi:MAG TPA: YesL family protein [Clostridiales bacterium]|nr:YesL family protein [Clostridiales bacterium]
MNDGIDLDNPVLVALSKLFDLVMISIICLVLSIPIFTIGPSTTALYYSVVKVLRRERGYITKEYFKSFKLNFKKGAIISIILIPAYIIIYFDFVYANFLLKQGNSLAYLLFGIFTIIGTVLVLTTLYIFPVLSRFELKLKETFNNSLILSIRHLPSTIAMLLIIIIALLILYTFPVAIVIMPATLTYFISLLMEKVFKKYIPKDEKPQEKTKTDTWYME